MAEKTTVARPYAVAAYRLAKQLKAQDRWSETLAEHLVQTITAPPSSSRPPLSPPKNARSRSSIASDRRQKLNLGIQATA